MEILNITTISIIIITSIIGLASIVSAIIHKSTISQNQHLISIVPLSGHVEKIEYIIRSMLIQFQQTNIVNSQPYIIIIDMGIDDETKKICCLFAEKNNNISICKQDELPSFIKSNFILYNK